MILRRFSPSGQMTVMTKRPFLDLSGSWYGSCDCAWVFAANDAINMKTRTDNIFILDIGGSFLQVNGMMVMCWWWLVWWNFVSINLYNDVPMLFSLTMRWFDLSRKNKRQMPFDGVPAEKQDPHFYSGVYLMFSKRKNVIHYFIISYFVWRILC